MPCPDCSLAGSAHALVLADGLLVHVITAMAALAMTLLAVMVIARGLDD
jgi:hypothetical protein